jgi:hypothetical protein
MFKRGFGMMTKLLDGRHAVEIAPGPYFRSPGEPSREKRSR